MRLAVAIVAAACPVAAVAYAGRGQITARTSAALAWMRPAGTLGTQVAGNTAMIAECVDRLNGYDRALHIIGAGMLGQQQKDRRGLHAVKAEPAG